MPLAPLVTAWADANQGIPESLIGGAGESIGVFPDDPLPVRVELLLAGSWVDITGYVYARDQIQISRGLSSEGQTATAQTCALTINNRDGRFSPRNPNGPWFGVIGRN